MEIILDSTKRRFNKNAQYLEARNKLLFENDRLKRKSIKLIK